MLIVILLILCALATSCGACRSPQTETTSRDSVIIVRRDSLVLRDSVVFVEFPKESQVVETFADSSRLETSLAVSEAVVRGGILRHSLRNKDGRLETTIQVPERYLITEASSDRVQVIREIVEVEKELTDWQRTKMNFGSTVIWVGALVLLWFAFKALFIRH